MIRIVIADDHTLVRQGLKALLEKVPDIAVIGEAENGQQAVELVEQHQPDVLIMDMAMPRLNGIQATEQIRARELPTQVVMLSMYSDPLVVQQALRSGVKGYLLKRSVTEELLLAIRAAVDGETYLSPAIAAQLVGDFLSAKAQEAEATPLDLLSPREREVLKLIAEGNSNTQIAELLTLSVKTVEKHRANIMEKLNVHDVTGLVRVAIKYGLVSLDS